MRNCRQSLTRPTLLLGAAGRTSFLRVVQRVLMVRALQVAELVFEARTEHVHERLSVSLAEQTVQQEVAGGVDGHQEVEHVVERARDVELLRVLRDVAQCRVNKHDRGR